MPSPPVRGTARHSRRARTDSGTRTIGRTVTTERLSVDVERRFRAVLHYLDALAALDTDTPISTLVDRVCRSVHWQGRSVRALRPWDEDDRLLLKAIGHGEFAVNGMRNRDLLSLLFPEASSLPAEERRRYSARVTRKLRMLRAHGIIRKVQGTHRYVLTKGGEQVVTAILQYQQLTMAQLQKACA